MSRLLNAWIEDISDDLHELDRVERFLEKPAVFRDAALFGNNMVGAIGNHQDFDAGGEGYEFFYKGYMLWAFGGGGCGVIQDKEIDGWIQQEIAEGARLG
jgi:hypothetical protein